MWLFESRGRCWICHTGDNLSDELFHNTGVSFGTPQRDEGRYEVTRQPSDRFRFKTPSLRGVALTAPYFHDGSAATLEDVVRFYNRGGNPEDPGLDESMQPLKLTDEEVTALAEFLRALTPAAENPR
jgi:cytochrome c peroxidase